MSDVSTEQTSSGHGELVLEAQAQDLLFRQARTANTFTDEPVTDAQMRAIYDLVKFAPTSMNTQPARIVLVRSGQARERLVAHMSPGNQAKTAAAPLVAVVTADREFHENIPQIFPHNPGAKAHFQDAAAREKFSAFNATLQLGYFILGVRAAGLSAGPMTGFDGPALEADLFPEGDQKVIAVVNIGHPGPEAWLGRLPRLNYDQVVSTL
jgi:3-hydroxypropanoate dehydrogenase